MTRDVESEVSEVMESVVRRVVAKAGRRVSFSAEVKAGDGICNPRHRILVNWFKTCALKAWHVVFDYGELSFEELKWLKEDTEDLFQRIYNSPTQTVPLVSTGVGNIIVSSRYLLVHMTQEINYLHTNYNLCRDQN